jgi:nucleobase:cation symporter-1, NCS1 family
VLAYAAAIPFMNTTLIQGPIAKAWHGADIAYFVNLSVAAVLYGGYRLLRDNGVSARGRTAADR